MNGRKLSNIVLAAAAISWGLIGCQSAGETVSQQAVNNASASKVLSPAAVPAQTPQPAASAAVLQAPVQPVYTPTTASPGEMESAASAKSKVIGRPAPDFTLPDVSGNNFTLSAHRGKWVVLYFYPQADTPGCTCQATEFTKLLSSFSALDAEVVGVAPDSPGSLGFFAEKYKLEIQLLSDPEKSVMRLYGAWIDQTIAGAASGRVIRSTFLISPAGSIAWHWPEVIPEGHAARVKDVLEKVRKQ